MLYYQNYNQDLADIVSLLRQHKESGRSDITSYLAKASVIACRYFKQLLEEKHFFSWLNKPEIRDFYNERDIFQFNQIIIPQTGELMGVLEYKQPDFVRQVAKEAQDLLNECKVKPRKKKLLQPKIKILQEEICNQADRINNANEFADEVVQDKQFGDSGVAYQKEPKGNRIWKKLNRAAIVGGILSPLISIFQIVSQPPTPPVNDKEDHPVEVQATPPRPLHPNTYDATMDFYNRAINFWEPPEPDEPSQN